MLRNLVQRLLIAAKNANEDFTAKETGKVSFDALFSKETGESSLSVPEIESLSIDTNSPTTSNRNTRAGKDAFEINPDIHVHPLTSNANKISEQTPAIAPKPGQDVRITQPGGVKSASFEEITSDRFTSGVFVVGESGEVGFDFLFDGGKHRSELAIFSLEGMEKLEFGSTAFIEEASRRALTGSQWGHVVIRDRTEGAKFDGKLEHKNWNKGEYQGVKTFEMNAGDRFGVMLIPNGTVKQVHQKPNSKGAKKPLFSLVIAL